MNTKRIFKNRWISRISQDWERVVEINDNWKIIIADEESDATPEEIDEVASLVAASPELLEACEYALKNLKPAGDIKKDFSGHNAIAALSTAIHNAKTVK